MSTKLNERTVKVLASGVGEDVKMRGPSGGRLGRVIKFQVEPGYDRNGRDFVIGALVDGPFGPSLFDVNDLEPADKIKRIGMSKDRSKRAWRAALIVNGIERVFEFVADEELGRRTMAALLLPEYTRNQRQDRMWTIESENAGQWDGANGAVLHYTRRVL